MYFYIYIYIYINIKAYETKSGTVFVRTKKREIRRERTSERKNVGERKRRKKDRNFEEWKDAVSKSERARKSALRESVRKRGKRR